MFFSGEKGPVSHPGAVLELQLQELVARLAALGVADRTLVLFTSDNGTNRKIVSRMGAREVKGGKVEFRTDRVGNVHLPIGKASFEASDLSANLKAAIEELERLKPSSAKGRYLKKVSVSSTMGPGIRIAPLRVAE